MMDDKWNSFDLKLTAEKKAHEQSVATKEEWTVHISKLQEGDLIDWNGYGGYYRTPYDNVNGYRITFLGADKSVRLQLSRVSEFKIELGFYEEWSSAWYEKDGSFYRISIRVIESIYPVSQLPPDIRTREQIDADAWAEAVRKGLI